MLRQQSDKTFQVPSLLAVELNSTINKEKKLCMSVAKVWEAETWGMHQRQDRAVSGHSCIVTGTENVGTLVDLNRSYVDSSHTFPFRIWSQAITKIYSPYVKKPGRYNTFLPSTFLPMAGGRGSCPTFKRNTSQLLSASYRDSPKPLDHKNVIICIVCYSRAVFLHVSNLFQT